ncbi:alpha/beta hydrolase [Actinomadura graeca]|uniref:Alpha/beta hydrolase n=1 Tax=Actinomadura graeca TaxID=2750812 RepID=A0ABX8QTM3_9ACTN|nr:alpha/beta hydrolase [Actinomadura graeca]QXJ21309.1 alpha/beta hydrolase [Actinomadura graeca]
MSPWSDARPDVLGPGYEAIDLPMGEDGEGPVCATLVRRAAPRAGTGAVLCLHGYNDYFFNVGLADFLAARGRDFYALDLRKCGRSWRPHQTRLHCRSLGDYMDDIDAAMRVISEVDGHDDVLLVGHSMGGLVSALWLAERGGDGPVSALCLNSPFLSSGVPRPLRAVMDPLLVRAAGRRPLAAFPGRLSPRYPRSLHRSHHGTWDFDEGWKSTSGTRLRLGWLAAVHAGQRAVRAGLGVTVPVLVLCSDRSSGRRAPAALLRRSDCVLDVAAIRRLAPRLGADVTVQQVEGAVHDVFLSGDGARRAAYDALGRWLSSHLPHPAG